MVAVSAVLPHGPPMMTIAAMLGPGPVVLTLTAMLLHRPSVMRFTAAMVGPGPLVAFRAPLASPLNSSVPAMLAFAIRHLVVRTRVAPARMLLVLAVLPFIRVAPGRWTEVNQRRTDRQACGERLASPIADHDVSPLAVAVVRGARSLGWLL
jgi:hypothetical protein